MYDVKSYRLSEGDVQLSSHFKLHEFQCSDGSDVVFVSPALVDILENIRVHFGAAVTITSAYRTEAFNARTDGSSKKSKHCEGLAADIQVTGHTPREVYDYACRLLGDHGGVGIYDTFVHVDVRSKKSRFDYRKKK